jgi:branched-subunit amino acid aminotransferase/4-amino-4-deoxychorismate lyase
MPAQPALIETIRIRNGTAPLAELHRRRLAASCEALGIPCPARLALPEGGPDRVVRLEVSAGGVNVTERPVELLAAARLVTSRVPHAPYPHKTTERGQFDRTLAEARTLAADDGVMLTAGGLVAECAIWTLFWWEGDTLCTPALSLGVLPGVARTRIAELVLLAEREAPRRELDRASVFVANAARGIVPVAVLDGRALAPNGGTARLQALFWDRHGAHLP